MWFHRNDNRSEWLWQNNIKAHTVDMQTMAKDFWKNIKRTIHYLVLYADSHGSVITTKRKLSLTFWWIDCIHLSLIFVCINTNPVTHWWEKLPCKAMTCSTGAVWVSVSCSRTLRDAACRRKAGNDHDDWQIDFTILPVLLLAPTHMQQTDSGDMQYDCRMSLVTRYVGRQLFFFSCMFFFPGIVGTH